MFLFDAQITWRSPNIEASGNLRVGWYFAGRQFG
jgi:hypothetical protein